MNEQAPLLLMKKGLTDEISQPLVFLMVPKTGFEPAQAYTH
jgi:hypothetical protein